MKNPVPPEKTTVTTDYFPSAPFSDSPQKKPKLFSLKVPTFKKSKGMKRCSKSSGIIRHQRLTTIILRYKFLFYKSCRLLNISPGLPARPFKPDVIQLASGGALVFWNPVQHSDPVMYSIQYSINGTQQEKFTPWLPLCTIPGSNMKNHQDYS